MANHNLPTLTSTYANFVNEMDARMDDISIGFDPALTTATNMATGTICWMSASNKWQKWSGSAWNDLAATYAISISGNAATATQLATPRAINGVAFNGTAPISINLNNSLIVSNAGGGVASGTAFNGGSAATISYNSIGAPSTTGIGATGTWSISITGNAITATTATNVNSGTVNATTGNFSGVLTANAAIQEKQITVASNNLDLALGNFFTKTIAGATTFTLTNVPSSSTAVSFILDITNGGSAVITWFTGVRWPNGIPPALTTAGRDILGFFTYDSGVTWTGLLLGKDIK